MTIKICPTCDTAKDLRHFHKNKTKKDGHASYCRVCSQITNLRYYKNNRKKIRDGKRRSVANATDFIDAYKRERACITCGERRVYILEFHHRDPAAKFKTIAVMRAEGYGIEFLQEEIDKCDLLCCNCHRELHYLEKQSLNTTKEN